RRIRGTAIVFYVQLGQFAKIEAGDGHVIGVAPLHPACAHCVGGFASVNGHLSGAAAALQGEGEGCVGAASVDVQGRYFETICLVLGFERIVFTGRQPNFRVLLHDLLEAPNVSNRQTLIKLRMEGVRALGDDAVGAGINIKVLHGLKLDGEDVGNHLRIARARPQERRPVDGSGNVGTWAESAVSVTDVTVVDINDVSTKKVEEVVHDQV